MSINSETITYIAKLSRIAIEDKDLMAVQERLNATLAFVEQLSTVNVYAVEPTFSVVPQVLTQRKDRVIEGDQAEALMQNAPAHQDHFFLVPKIIE